MDESTEFRKFLLVLTGIERKKEFDRKVDRLKKSSSATTVWAVLPGLLGIYGIAHFYLNRPIEGLVILGVGLTVSVFSVVFSAGYFIAPYLSIFSSYTYNKYPELVIVWWCVNISFFVGNIISARYNYSRYDFYIHLKGKKPWNNWGLDSLM